MTASTNVLDPALSDDDWDDLPTTDRVGRRWWPFVVAIVVILLGVSLVLPAGRHQWAVSIFRQPTPYTALSFENAANLPTTVARGADLDLSFSVTNHEGRTVPYSYVITSSNASTGGRSATLLRGSATVASGRSQIVGVHVVPRCTSSTCKVQVSLPGHSERIDALVSVKGAAK